MHRVDTTRSRPLLGLRWGAIAAVILLGIYGLLRAAGADGSGLPPGISLSEQLLLYVIGSLCGGLVVGALLPLSRRPSTSAILGILAVAPYFAAQWWLSEDGSIRSSHSLVGAAVATVVIGGVVGFWVGLRQQSRSE